MYNYYEYMLPCYRRSLFGSFKSTERNDNMCRGIKGSKHHLVLEPFELEVKKFILALYFLDDASS